MSDALQITLAGEFYKLGGGSVPRIQKRYFTLVGHNLEYYDSKGGPHKGTIEILGAKLVDRGTYMEKLCFSVEGENAAKGLKEYFLFFDGRESKNGWFSALCKASKRYTFLKDTEADEKRIQRSPVYHIISSHTSNRTCADCDQPNPTWTVLAPFGVFVCIECIGVHRKLWAPRCKEVQLDAWSAEDMQFISNRGNAAVNQELEFDVPDSMLKPRAHSLTKVREAYITAKYNLGFAGGPQPTVETAAAPIKTSHPPKFDPTPQPATSDGEIPFGAPPKYTGIAVIILHETLGNFQRGGVRASLTNGFQEVRSTEGSKGDEAKGGGTKWGNQILQIGLDTPHRPLYITFYNSGGTIVGTTEIILSQIKRDPTKSVDVGGGEMGKGLEEPTPISLKIEGNHLQNCSVSLTVSFTKLT